MALAALSEHLQSGMNNVAAVLNRVGAGASGLLKNSDVIWISTAAAYGATKIATDHKWIAGMNPNYAAALVFIVSSIHAIASGIFSAPEANVPMDQWENKGRVVIANTAVASLGAAYFLSLDVADYKTSVVAAAVAGVVRVHYLKQTILKEYFKAGVETAKSAINKVRAGVSDVASTIQNAGFSGWLAYSDVTWISTAVTYFLTKFAINEKWISGVNPGHAAAFMFAASSTAAIAQAIIPNNWSNKNLIQAANSVAVPLLVAHHFKWSVDYTTGVATAAVYGVVKMVHQYFYPVKV